MKKTLIGLGAAVLVLGLAVWLVGRKDEGPPAPAPLALPGYATPEQLAEEKGRGMLDAPVEIDYPVDAIRIEREGEVIELVRDGTGKDTRWSLAAPRKAAAVRYQVEKMLTPFRDETASILARQVADDDLALFDLEPERRIRLTLKAGGQVWNGVDLLVGKVAQSEAETAEEGAASDTWVARPEAPGTVYRVAGKDLRTPLEADLDALRDKKLFDVKADDVARVAVTAPDGARIALVADRTEEPPAEEGGEPKVTVTWRLEEPAGVEADDTASALARNLANARTKAFVPVAEAPADALAGATWKLEATLADGGTLGLTLADGDAEEVWGRVEGADELVKLDKFTAGNLRKRLEDVRDKALLPVAQAAITGLVLAPEEGGPVTLTRTDEGWRFEGPLAAVPTDVDAALKALAEAKATRFAYASEREAAAAAAAAPEATARVVAGERTWELAFGPKLEAPGLAGQRWVAVTGPGAPAGPLLVQDFVAARFRKGADDLRRKALFDLDKASLQRLEVVPPGGGDALVLERDEAGALQPVGLPEGKEADAPKITTLVATLPSLRAKGFADGVRPADVGLEEGKAWKLVGTDGEGRTATLLVAAGDAADPHAVALDGPLAGTVVTLNGFQAKNLQKRLADVTK